MAEPYEIEPKVANRAVLTMDANGIRLTFGEALPKRNPDDLNEKELVRYHTAVYLPGIMGEALRDLLTEALEQHEAQQKPN